MKNPDGTIDLIGSAMQLGSGIVSLVQEFAPEPAQRKINIAIRRLRHRFKKVPVETYVKVNFPELTKEGRTELIQELKEVLGRN